MIRKVHMVKNNTLKGACREALSILANALEDDAWVNDDEPIHNEAIKMASNNKRSACRVKQQSPITLRGKKG